MRVFLVTGAGVSAESGLGTFRDKGGTGIWTRFDPMKLATPEAFVRDPQEVYAFYNARRRNLITAKPNAAHFALARLEAALAERGGNLTLSSPKTSMTFMSVPAPELISDQSAYEASRVAPCRSRTIGQSDTLEVVIMEDGGNTAVR